MALFRVTWYYSMANVAMENVFYFESSGSASDLCTWVKDHWVAYLKKLQSQNCATSGIKAVEVGHLILDPDYYYLQYTAVGERPGTTSDPQLALNVALHTGLSGRHRRGRFFLGGVPDDDVTNGQFTDLTSGQGHVNEGIVQCTAAGAQGKIQVFSRTIFASLTDIILDSYKQVTTATIQPIMSTMRSRKPHV